MAPYPLTFDPMLFEKVWGGRRLEGLGKSLPPGKQIGESWELADLSATSASGAGGAAARSVIAAGPMKGQTLHDALTAWGNDLLGAAKPTPPTPDGNFPLLVKFLDARENLSVQVHPSPAYAAAHPEAHLKTESWYILDAEPAGEGGGAQIYKGLRAGMTPQLLAKRVADGTLTGDLRSVPAVVGDCHNLPSGTLHALGAGVLVAEVQTPSDTTFRVYDWGRRGRELHIKQALECIDLGRPPDEHRFFRARAGADGFSRLVTTEFFTMDEAQPHVGSRAPASTTPTCSALMVLKGSVELSSSSKSFEPMPMRTGTTVLLPAAIAEQCIIAAPEPARLLRASLV